MQAPVGVAPVPPKLATVAPAALDASEAVTSEHASTFEISTEVGVGLELELLDDAEGELDDPHAPIKRPTTAPRAIAPLCRTRTWPARLNLGAVVPKRTAAGLRKQFELRSADRITRRAEVAQLGRALD